MKKLTCIVLLAAAACEPGSGTDTIVPYGRANNSGTYMYFKEHVLANKDYAPIVQTAAGTGQLINSIVKDKNGIGYGGIGYAKGVKALPVKKNADSAAVKPTMENVIDGSYPISRSLYFYTAGPAQGAAARFIEWVLTDEAQKICEDAGYYPLPKGQRPAAAPGAPPEGKHSITIKGSDTMVILVPRWAQAYMSKYPGVKIEVTGGGSGTGIAALINGETTICMASRPMSPKEKDQLKAKIGKDAVETPVALDGLAIFVNESNPIQEISLEQLKEIFTGKTTKWSELAGSRK